MSKSSTLLAKQYSGSHWHEVQNVPPSKRVLSLFCTSPASEALYNLLNL
jgi:hypothetical protein